MYTGCHWCHGVFQIGGLRIHCFPPRIHHLNSFITVGLGMVLGGSLPFWGILHLDFSSFCLAKLTNIFNSSELMQSKTWHETSQIWGFLSLFKSVVLNPLILLMVQKSCTTWDVRTLYINGKNYQPQLVIAGFLNHQQYLRFLRLLMPGNEVRDHFSREYLAETLRGQVLGLRRMSFPWFSWKYFVYMLYTSWMIHKLLYTILWYIMICLYSYIYIDVQRNFKWLFHCRKWKAFFQKSSNASRPLDLF